LESILIVIGLLFNILGVIIIITVMAKLMNRLFSLIRGNSMDWITIEDVWLDSRKKIIIGIGIIIVGFVLQIFGTLI